MLLTPIFVALLLIWTGQRLILLLKTKRFNMNFKKVFEHIKGTGGASYGLFSGIINPEAGYMVACVAERIYDAPVSYYDFKAAVGDYLANVPFPDSYDLDEVYLGFWINEGRLVIDFAEVILSKDDAIAEGKKRNQLAIFDNELKQDIRL